MDKPIATHQKSCRSLFIWIGLLLAAMLASCSDTSNETAEDNLPTRDNSQEVKDYYAANPDFFSFKSPADMPSDLIWEDGSDLEEVGSNKARKGGTQYGALQDFPRTLRVVGPDSNGSFRPWILDGVVMSLAHAHPNDQNQFYPGLAERWAVSEATKTTYVKLNPAATWSDGRKITADDYLFTFFFYQSSYIVAPWYNNWYGTMYTNITKYDDYTISISLPEVKPNMHARTLGLSPTPQHFYKELADDFVERYQWRFVPTTGAYRVVDKDIKKGRSIALTRVENWWAGSLKSWRYRFNADRIHLSVIRDTPKVFEAFRRGDLDQFSLNLAEYWYEKLPDDDPDVANGYIEKKTFYNQRPRPTYGLWINTSRPNLDNLDVRLGINHATNWDMVIERFFRGDFQRLKTTSDGYGEFSHPSLAPRAFNIELALEHFAKAGFKERGPDGILVNDEGTRLAFTITSGYEALKDILTILKEEAAKAGLEFRIEVLDGTAAWKKVQEKKHEIQFSAFGVALEMYPRYWETYHSVNAWDQAFLADGSPNPDRKLKTQTNNLEVIAVPEIDAMIDQYRLSSSKTEMIELAHKLDEALYDHASFVPAYKQSFYRLGHWRWVKYPDDFNMKHSASAGQYFIHWIDADIKNETLNARKSGSAYSPVIEVYDQYRLK